MTCKDCIHYDLCRSCSHIQLGWHGNSVHYVENIEEICKDFKARSRFVELPAAHWIRHTPDKNIMQEFHKQGIGRGMSENSIFWTCSNCGGWGNLSFNYCPSCGAKIEEAEQALKLKERENDAE